MESLETLEAHRRGVSHLVPILDAVRSIAELAWRHAERGFHPLDAYAQRLQTAFERMVAALTGEERAAFAPRDHLPVGLLFVSSERGLCGPFNERVVEYGLAQARSFTEKGAAVRYLCVGNRSRRLFEASGVTLLYTRALASLSVPAYVDIQEAALDLLGLTHEKAFGRLFVVHNAPARRFQYAPTIRQLLPPVLPVLSGPPAPATVIPAGDTPILLTHLMTEQVLVGLFRSVMESVISEQLARIYTMRLAADNARRLVDELTAQCNLARRNAITNSLLEIVAGYEATVHKRQAANAGVVEQGVTASSSSARASNDNGCLPIFDGEAVVSTETTPTNVHSRGQVLELGCERNCTLKDWHFSRLLKRAPGCRRSSPSRTSGCSRSSRLAIATSQRRWSSRLPRATS